MEEMLRTGLKHFNEEINTTPEHGWLYSELYIFRKWPVGFVARGGIRRQCWLVWSRSVTKQANKQLVKKMISFV